MSLKGRVLLLNASYEVLGTIGVARAMRMTLRDENPVVIEKAIEGEFLHSGSGKAFPVPSVLVLKHFIDLPKKRLDAFQRGGNSGKRLRIFHRDKNTCQYCGIKVGKKIKDPETGKRRKMETKDLTLDHISPKSKGGTSLPTNLVTACKPCNQRKADRTPQQANMPLRTEIHDVTSVGIDKLLICKYVEHRSEWLEYLQNHKGYKEILNEMGYV